MARLIDADDFIAAYCDRCNYFRVNGLCSKESPVCGSVRLVTELPSIDLVRCRDCKSWDIEHPDTGQGWCIKVVGYRYGEWFCAAGERKKQ